MLTDPLDTKIVFFVFSRYLERERMYCSNLFRGAGWLALPHPYVRIFSREVAVPRPLFARALCTYICHVTAVVNVPLLARTFFSPVPP